MLNPVSSHSTSFSLPLGLSFVSTSQVSVFTLLFSVTDNSCLVLPVTFRYFLDVLLRLF